MKQFLSKIIENHFENVDFISIIEQHQQNINNTIGFEIDLMDELDIDSLASEIESQINERILTFSSDNFKGMCPSCYRQTGSFLSHVGKNVSDSTILNEGVKVILVDDF